MDDSPTGTGKAVVALNVMMWLAIAWFVGGVTSTFAGPPPPAPPVKPDSVAAPRDVWGVAAAPLRQVQSEPEPAKEDESPRSGALAWTDHDAEIAEVTETGLKIVALKAGTGRGVAATDGVVVEYYGALENGTVFDSTQNPKFGHEEPFRLSDLRSVIPGWREGLIGMQVGEVRKLWIPYQLGYGASGQPPLIPPRSALIFEIELLEITKSDG